MQDLSAKFLCDLLEEDPAAVALSRSESDLAVAVSGSLHLGRVLAKVQESDQQFDILEVLVPALVRAGRINQLRKHAERDISLFSLEALKQICDYPGGIKLVLRKIAEQGYFDDDGYGKIDSVWKAEFDEMRLRSDYTRAWEIFLKSTKGQVVPSRDGKVDQWFGHDNRDYWGAASVALQESMLQALYSDMVVSGDIDPVTNTELVAGVAQKTVTSYTVPKKRGGEVTKSVLHDRPGLILASRYALGEEYGEWSKRMRRYSIHGLRVLRLAEYFRNKERAAKERRRRSKHVQPTQAA